MVEGNTAGKKILEEEHLLEVIEEQNCRGKKMQLVFRGKDDIAKFVAPLN
jgi:hypothetical protein